jgi:hypothetical protein
VSPHIDGPYGEIEDNKKPIKTLGSSG